MPDVNEGPQRGPFAYPCPTKRAGKNVRIYTGGNNQYNADQAGAMGPNASTENSTFQTIHGTVSEADEKS